MNTKFVMAALLLGGLMGIAIPEAKAQDRPTTLKVLMIQAQNDSAPIDRRLEKVEYRLRRVFGFQFYRYMGEGSIALLPGGEGTIRLPQGHQLQIRLSGRGRAEVRWFQNNNALLSTGVGISRDAPVVLGGVPSGDGKLILVLTAD